MKKNKKSSHFHLEISLSSLDFHHLYSFSAERWSKIDWICFSLNRRGKRGWEAETWYIGVSDIVLIPPVIVKIEIRACWLNFPRLIRLGLSRWPFFHFPSFFLQIFLPWKRFFQTFCDWFGGKKVRRIRIIMICISFFNRGWEYIGLLII